MVDDTLTNCAQCGVKICAEVAPIFDDSHVCHNCYADLKELKEGE